MFDEFQSSFSAQHEFVEKVCKTDEEYRSKKGEKNAQRNRNSRVTFKLCDSSECNNKGRNY